MHRLYVFVALAILVFLLHRAFPYVLQDENARMNVLYLVLLLSLAVGGGWRRLRAMTWPKAVRDASIWVALVLVLVMAYSFKDEFGNNRLLSALMPSHVQANGDGTFSIRASSDGHFHAHGEVNGVAVRFLIDTGATDIVLSPDDARRAGIDPDALAYDRYTMTANGTGNGAQVTLGSLRLGGITLHQLPAEVNKVWMNESLLGMSFLKKLHGFRVEGDTLVLVP